MEKQTVSSLTFALKNQLENHFSKVCVIGEISNFKRHSSGHLYFDLKDAGAKIGGVIFRSAATRLPHLPKEGDQVIAYGSITLYPPHGKYQIVVQKLEFSGTGALLIELEKRKNALKERGWFDPEHKKTLPVLPTTIGVVTSPTGAVIRDIIHVLERRAQHFHLILNPVRVQGEMAAGEIATAIKTFNRYQLADVLIVGRGGGSLEDLWPFNEESVCQAIFESAIPIISAVGHETDITLSDFVADKRAPTPSAAAEIVSTERDKQLQFLTKSRQQIASHLSHQLQKSRAELAFFQKHPKFATPLTLVAEPLQKIDEIKAALDQKIQQSLMEKRLWLKEREKRKESLGPLKQLLQVKHKMLALEHALQAKMHLKIEMTKQRLYRVVEQLKALDPKNVLKRGYSILFAQKSGSVIVSKQALHKEDVIEALLSDGRVKMKVEE